jgi:hypothetical protein
VPLTQELVDMARSQRLIEATGTLHATSGNELGYQLTDSGKARALDALSQSEYYGAVPVPLALYQRADEAPVGPQHQAGRDQLVAGMGHLILPEDLIANLGPAVTSGRSILMYGPPGNGKSSISQGIRRRSATRSMCRAPSNIPGRSSRSTTPSSIRPPKRWSTTPASCAAPRTVRPTLCLLRPAQRHHRRRTWALTCWI